MKRVKRRYVHPKNFVSNIEKRDKDVLLKCATKRGISIYIEDRAFDGNGYPLKGLCSVFSSNDVQDMSDLWIEFNYIVSLVKRGQVRTVIEELKSA